MMRFAVLLLCLSAGVSAQWNVAYESNWREVKAGPGVNFWVTTGTHISEFDWKNVAGAMVFSLGARRWPLEIPNVGRVYVDLNYIIFTDLVCPVRLLESKNEGLTRYVALTWTKLPDIPPAMIGTVLHYQVLLYSTKPPLNSKLLPQHSVAILPA